jgi:16S rRNA (guanine527-N7)-methyltransferase
MPRPNRSDLPVLLAAGAKVLDIQLSDFQINQFMSYLEDLKKWNRSINLTAIIADKEIIEKHFLDSLVGLKAIDKRPGQTLLDIGTGAGFPGVPLKIAFPALRLSLIESSQKKAAFLHHLAGKLKLFEVTILNQPIENLLNTDRYYDLIVIRAFAKIQIALARALPLLAPRGKLILYQGRMQTHVHEMNGWETTIQYELPFSKIRRCLEIFSRSS